MEGEKAKLDKMIKHCQFTRVKQAYFAMTESSDALIASFSMSSDNDHAGATKELRSISKCWNHCRITFMPEWMNSHL
jgi:hypothetical protein